ncbi:hypothetical protein HDV05_001406, partial [Chytridiales sp. JEL 0842]
MRISLNDYDDACADDNHDGLELDPHFNSKSDVLVSTPGRMPHQTARIPGSLQRGIRFKPSPPIMASSPTRTPTTITPMTYIPPTTPSPKVFAPSSYRSSSEESALTTASTIPQQRSNATTPFKTPSDPTSSRFASSSPATPSPLNPTTPSQSHQPTPSKRSKTSTPKPSPFKPGSVTRSDFLQAVKVAGSPDSKRNWASNIEKEAWEEALSKSMSLFDSLHISSTVDSTVRTPVQSPQQAERKRQVEMVAALAKSKNDDMMNLIEEGIKAWKVNEEQERKNIELAEKE